jgi:NCAIR mutase (PurE)-related protein
VAEEAARTAELMGNEVTRLYDVAVAGVSVVNIDNGFSAANIASLINHL